MNGISLQVVSSDSEQLVAIKPVCEILGVNYTTQVEKLKAHPIFGSVIPLRGTTGADGKTYQMLWMIDNAEGCNAGSVRVRLVLKRRPWIATLEVKRHGN